MPNPKRSDVISLFLEQNTHEDLFRLYNQNMEVQVNVAQDNGKRVDQHYRGKDWHAWSDGIQTWKTFRIPRNAWVEPVDNDYEITFDLSTHVEGIGLTGWDWQNQQSIWVAYDFDAIIGHSDKHKRKLDPQQLEEVKQRLMAIDWVTIRYSTSGSGLHVYVFLESIIKTCNHNEHMALARAILSQLSIEANFDFKSKVDVHGAVMWFWHRKMRTSMDGNGLKIIKQGSKLKQVPPNWKDHLDVVKGNRRRIVPFFIKDSDKPETFQDMFDELSGQKIRVELDLDHYRLIDWLKNNVPGGSWWDSDHHMLVTHTAYLRDAHKSLKMKGIFRTVAEGKQYGADYNCFLYPLYKGVWVVRRYNPGTIEDPTWTQDGSSWTFCYFNRIPTFDNACRAFGGVEHPKGGYVFQGIESPKSVLEAMGSDTVLPEKFSQRPIILKEHKDGRIVIEVENIDKMNDSSDPAIKNWILDKKIWKRIFDIDSDNQGVNESNDCDKYLRHVVTEAHQNYGWVIKSDGTWKQEPLEHVKLMLEGTLGYKPMDGKRILGTAIMQPWTIVNRPFEEEFLPNRQWNRNAVKFRFKRSQNLEDLKFPTWLNIFNHLGKGLDYAIKDHPWAKMHNIKTGADYLLLWVACLFQYPTYQLPYLFFWSEKQGTGKSTLHESLSLLITPSGYMNANKALEPSNTFNGELETAILCFVEERDLRSHNNKQGTSIAYNRIKEWVTAKQILIHPKTKTPYLVPNTSHWIQSSNNPDACPVFPGDRRIVVIYVEPLDSLSIIPRIKMEKMLQDEASDFLAYVLNIQIPESNEPLILPVLETEEKTDIVESNMTALQRFIKEYCFYVQGETILWKEFYEEFIKKMDIMGEIDKWTKPFTSRCMPKNHKVGQSSKDGLYYVPNISWTEKPSTKPRILTIDKKLCYTEQNDTISNNGQNGEETNGTEKANRIDFGPPDKSPA